MAALLVLQACFALPRAAAAAPADAVRAHLEALTGVLPPATGATVVQIDGLPRQLLAVRSYLKVGEHLTARWSWSEQQTREFEASNEHRKLMASIAAVTARFETENPGYTLFANTQVRSLELQLQRWNANPRVGKVAEELYSSLARELRAQAYPPLPDADSLQRCREFLVRWRPSVAAPLAAPGLSAHGQLRAVDFQVRKGQQIIAGTEVAMIARDWVKQGWAQRLQQVVSTLGSGFSGPLQSPNEPWHYSYAP